MKRLLYLVLFLVVLVLGLTFGLKNPDQEVEIKYYFGLYWSGSLSIVLLATLVFGALLGFLGSLSLIFRQRRRVTQTQKQIRKLEEEISNLRALPIKDVI